MYVVLVCRSGGHFGPRNVARLKSQLPDHDVICLTNFPKDSPGFEGVEVRPLKHNWYGWWSKIEFFRDDLFYLDCLFLDLSSVIGGDINKLKRDGFAMWSDPNTGGAASGVMYKPRECETKHIYKDFVSYPNKYMQKYAVGNGMPWGDQAYIAEKKDPDFLFRPPEVVSWKLHGDVEGAIVTCFHGRPKPYEVGL